MAGRPRLRIGGRDGPRAAVFEREEKFARHYAEHGNAAAAARHAGYSCKNDRTTHAIGAEVLRRPRVAEKVAKYKAELREKHIADREERQNFWTSVLNDPNQNMIHRLRASELLGKSQGDFSADVAVNINQAPSEALRERAAEDLVRNHPELLKRKLEENAGTPDPVVVEH